MQESRALAILAQGASNAGDQPTAMLLALAALPDPGFGGKRPFSFDVAAALDQAWMRNRETALAGHQGTVVSAAFSADGMHVVTASYDNTARVWDPRGPRPTFVALEAHQGEVRSASFSADGTHVGTASYDNAARVWDLRGAHPTLGAIQGGVVTRSGGVIFAGCCHWRQRDALATPQPAPHRSTPPPSSATSRPINANRTYPASL